MTDSTGKVLEVGTHLRGRAMVRGWVVADGNSVRSRRRAHYGRRWLGEAQDQARKKREADSVTAVENRGAMMVTALTGEGDVNWRWRSGQWATWR
jgi:hypothetical protein